MMNVVMKGRNRPERVHESEFAVDTDVIEDGSLLIHVTTSNFELRLVLGLRAEKATLALFAPDDFMSMKHEKHPPYEGPNGNTERIGEVSIELNDFMRENSVERYEHAGEVLVGALRAAVLAAERALSKQIDFVES
jgi:hypothetical protein